MDYREFFRLGKNLINKEARSQSKLKPVEHTKAIEAQPFDVVDKSTAVEYMSLLKANAIPFIKGMYTNAVSLLNRKK